VDGPPRGRGRWLGPVALAAIVAFGAYTRASGFTRGSLWFDDAWTAMPARVGLSTAVRMVTTAPGYTLALRSWLRVGPSGTWWAQLPAFVAGLAGIVAVFALLRYLRAWWPLPYLGALLIAASPVAADYSTRVKQFGFDLLLACLLVWLAERWRRAPSRLTAVAVAAACAGSLFISATTLVVAAGVAGVAVLVAVTDAARRREGALVAGTTAAAFAVTYVLWLRHLSPSLHYGWTKRGYLLSTVSIHRVAFSLEAMGTGLVHWMLGVPLGRGRVSTTVTPAGVLIALITAAVLLSVTLPPLVGVVRRGGRSPGPLVASALAVVLAVALALAGRSPFGGGRTDEVLYPCLLALAAGVLTPFGERLERRGAREGDAVHEAHAIHKVAGAPSVVAVVLVVVAAAGLVAVGATHRAAYPTTVLRPLAAELDAARRPGDVVVVDPWLTFTWAYDGLSPTAVSTASSQIPWSQGFHIVSLQPDRYVISTNYFLPDRAFSRIPRTSRLWYVASTVGRQSTVPGHANHLERTFTYDYLQQCGWSPAGAYLTAPHTEAILMSWHAVAASSSALCRPN
jgi:hypothetical protein